MNNATTKAISFISAITRRNLIDSLAQVPWWGRLTEVEFLSRLYDLTALPSTDSRHPDAEGDIIRHRVANHDWDDDWIFLDSRFGLDSGSDQTLLRFLAEIVHPEVRGNPTQTKDLVKIINSHISRDGWELLPVDKISVANYWLSGQGINNQGRVRSDNIASLECDGLLFRSNPEINLYRALKSTGVTFAPLRKPSQPTFLSCQAQAEEYQG